MLLIALGESVLAIGVGLGTGVESIGLDRIAFAAISLLLATTLYWAYFGVGEDARAEAALDALPADRAQAAGLASYGYAFWVILFGIVLSAAGLHHALVHPTDRSAGSTPPSCAWASACSGSGSACSGSPWAFPARCRAWPAGSCWARSSWSEPRCPDCVALLCLLLGSAALVLFEQRAGAPAPRAA